MCRRCVTLQQPVKLPSRLPLGLPFLAAFALSASHPVPASAAGTDAPHATASAPIRWLGDVPSPRPAGITFGVPWSPGVVRKEQGFALRDGAGSSLPVQTWPLAYWADGSVKWTGVATVAGPQQSGVLELSSADAAAASAPTAPALKVSRSDTTFEIDTGVAKVRVARTGTDLIRSIVREGREIVGGVRLECVLQDGAEGPAEQVRPRERFVSRVEKATLEQEGPVRAVVKFEGRHVGLQSGRAWLPFVVRAYLYAGQETVRLVHTIVFDGDQERDFIRGLAVVADVPFREEIHNRHVRLAGGEGGVWAEPVQPMVGRGGRFASAGGSRDDVYPEQVLGRRVPARHELSVPGQAWLADWAVWDDFKLVQPNADGFSIVKRTNPQSTWLAAAAGRRSAGLAFVGDVSGGLAVSVRNFWQSHPTALEINGAATGAARLTAWLWSPDAPAMDLRHYDTRAHGLEAAYEDVQLGFSTAHGVGRTSELTLFATTAVPSQPETAALAAQGAQPPVLVPTPAHLHAAKAFGTWGVEDRSTPFKAALEDRLAETLNFYLTQPEQHRWYGFWDFGDVMHSYDEGRHMWRYDLGGMAWANSELGPDLWLWYSFLRTGRADVFRMAEAMTRHTGEVDCYHLGRFAGLGSRHNVRHWGCGAKEARISQAAYRRFYYYLTGDERTGDLMREVVNADFKTIEFDPMRLAQPITEAERKVAPTRVRLGPDWFAFVGNWMTEWERTGDTRWRDKILAGVRSLAGMPLGLRTGKNLVFGYDPATGRLFQLNDDAGIYNLATIMGGAEVVFELNGMLDDAAWRQLWLQYCRLYGAPAEVVRRDMTTRGEGGDAAFVRDGRLATYVYAQTQDEDFLRVGLDALARFAHGERRRAIKPLATPAVVNPIDEGPANTNSASQDGLEVISMLGYAGDRLPSEMPPKPAVRGARAIPPNR